MNSLINWYWRDSFSKPITIILSLGWTIFSGLGVLNSSTSSVLWHSFSGLIIEDINNSLINCSVNSSFSSPTFLFHLLRPLWFHFVFLCLLFSSRFLTLVMICPWFRSHFYSIGLTITCFFFSILLNLNKAPLRFLKKHPYCNVFTFFCVYIDKDRIDDEQNRSQSDRGLGEQTIYISVQYMRKRISFLRMKFKII